MIDGNQMRHLLISKYNVEEITLPATKHELEALLTEVYNEGFQDGYDDGTNETKALKARAKSGTLD